MQCPRLPLLLVCAVLLTAPAPSAGFELLRVGSTCGNSRNLFWRLATVDVDARRLSAEYQALANEARQRWNQAVSGFRFESGAGDFCSLDDAVTSLGFLDSDCGGGNLGDALAVTRLRWDDRSGELLDADTVFNVNAGLLLNQDIFRQVAMHELGHVMGLDHSDACGQSGVGTLMQSFLSTSAPRITRPTDDDIAGANAIYDPIQAGPPPEGSNSCAIQPSIAGPSALLLGIPLLLFVLARRRTQRT
jgi:hypothetical protein